MNIEVKLAVLLHCYYYDVLPDIKKYLDNIKVAHDLFINIPESVYSQKRESEILQMFPKAKIKVSPNRGRDVGGFISLWTEYGTSEYTAALILHTKKSPHLHINLGATWRNELIRPLIGSPEIATLNIQKLSESAEIGIIGAKKYRSTTIQKNAFHYDSLVKLFDISDDNARIEFIAGTMMLIHPEVLNSLVSKLSLNSFEDATDRHRDFYLDGQVEHAVERFISCVARQLKKTIIYV